jgi:hypothetical protein
LSGQLLNGAEAVFAGLADLLCDSASLHELWQQLPRLDWAHPNEAIKQLTQPFDAATQDAKPRPRFGGTRP